MVSLAGVYLGMIVVGVLAAGAKWGSPGLLAFVVSCAWFVSPALVLRIMVLMAMPSMMMAGVEVKSFCALSVTDPLLQESRAAHPRQSWACLWPCSNHMRAACVYAADVPSAGWAEFSK